jgi:hypothetical protein
MMLARLTPLAQIYRFIAVMKRFIIIGVLFFSPRGALALSEWDLLIEPYLGYNFLGSSNLTAGVYSPSSSAYASFSGLAVGTRAGAQYHDLLFVAVDASYDPGLSVFTATHFQPTANAPLFANGAAHSKLGLATGLTLPFTPLRLWLGYTPLDSLAGIPSGTLSGTSFKVGVSTGALWSVFNLNLEYFLASYGRFTQASTDSEMNPAGALSIQYLMLSLSAPLLF